MRRCCDVACEKCHRDQHPPAVPWEIPRRPLNAACDGVENHVRMYRGDYLTPSAGGSVVGVGRWSAKWLLSGLIEHILPSYAWLKKSCFAARKRADRRSYRLRFEDNSSCARGKPRTYCPDRPDQTRSVSPLHESANPLGFSGIAGSVRVKSGGAPAVVAVNITQIWSLAFAREPWFRRRAPGGERTRLPETGRGYWSW